MHSQRLIQFIAITAITSSVFANPVPPREPIDNLPRGAPLVTDDVLLLDAPAFQTGEGGEWTASVRMFTHIRQVQPKIISKAVTTAIEALGIEIGDKVGNVLERSKLFFAIPRGGISVDLDVAGCGSASVRVGETSKMGLLEQSAGIGACSGSSSVRSISGYAPGFFKGRSFEALIFQSPPSGFGIVSDVDDTIKVSHVLDRKKNMQAIFVDDHEIVNGMPEFYSKLDGELGNPAWYYLTGSPYQLYPSLRKFIFEAYPKGPIITKNLTVTDIPSIFQNLSDDDILGNYKVTQLEKLRSFYPKKKFITIGDSTQADPEAYAEIARRYPDSIQCIFIRKVENADNREERFREAFVGVPESKWKVFTEPSEIMKLDVASGQCN
ncbi:hypothetical protein TWF102_003972 [Orbilia oligospora]|uniref:Phosphatidate phosphatase APP1 catalytic domain-containing protein n=1 Tax=Orbilia oligospora TaxID=2813651 RepID=A0A7C8NEZ2_ORBOL|nr:hypothetical protein TWF706_009788 [Orbilia oligospora]KAF3103158.1 hypothetical protein TWF102_003972 [Orbilia oligospora]KAF3111219.1 hypothetical protein TWF103_003893 [Orbilia oligospora]